MVKVQYILELKPAYLWINKRKCGYGSHRTPLYDIFHVNTNSIYNKKVTS